MRRQLPDQPRTFRLPGGDVIPFLAFYCSNLIVFWAGWTTDWKLFIAALLGFVLLAVAGATGQISSPMEWKAGASWIVPWFAGLAVLSYLGPYGGGADVLPFGWSFLVVAVFSAIVFWIALQVRLVPDTVAEHVEDSRREAQTGHVESLV